MTGIRLLGLVGLWAGGQRVFAGTPRLQALLAALALTPNDVVPGEVLIDRVWGEATPQQARNSLYTYVSRLRAALRETVQATLTQDGGGYILQVDPMEIDLHRSRWLASGVDDHPLRGDVDRLRQARDLWRGTPLAGIPGDWASRVRDSLIQERLTVLTKCFGAELAAGHHMDVIGRLSEAVTEYPFAEDLAGHLMVALHRSGRQSEALEVFRRTRERMINEIGAEPGAPLQTLHRAVLLHDPAISLEAPAAAQETQAASISTNASPATQAHTVPTPAQLPAGISTFTGRDEYLHSLDQMHELVKTSFAPLIITGMPGVGKTALAVHWTHRVKAQFPDGQLYLNLRGYAPGRTAMTATEALVALLGGLGIPAPAIPAEHTEIEGLYRSVLVERRVLILLDDAASVDQVLPLLPASDGCSVVVTSRDDLRGLTVLHDARRIVVRPLSVGDAETLLRRCIGDERASSEPQHLAKLAQLCGYLPLALRIAAANLGSRPAASLQAMVEQLSVPADKSTLELPGQGDSLSVLTSFEVSFRALTEQSRRLLCLLSLVSGTHMSSVSAAALAQAPMQQITGALDEITARHLLESDDGVRFRQHDLLRRFAQVWAERTLTQDERHAAKLRLYDHYLRSVDSAVARLYDPDRLSPTDPIPGSAPRRFNDDDSALRFLAEEYANIIEAARCAAGDGNQNFAWQIVDALRGYHATCRPRADWLVAALTGLEAAKSAGDPDAEAMMRRGLALAYDGMGRKRDADHHRAEAIRLNAASGDPHREAAAVLNSGNQRVRRNEFAEATADYELAAKLNQAIGNGYGRAVALINLGSALLTQGKIRLAIERAEPALVAFRDIASHQGEFECLHILSVAHAFASDIDSAIAHAQELMDKGMRVRAVRFTALAHVDLSRAYLFAGQFQLAFDHAASSASLCRELNDSLFLCPALTLRADSLREMGRTDEARSDYDQALRMAVDIGYLEGEINTLLGLAALDHATGDLDSATAHAQRGHRLSVQGNMRFLEGFALASLAVIDALRDELEAARKHATQALEILADVRHHPLTVHAIELVTTTTA